MYTNNLMRGILPAARFSNLIRLQTELDGIWTIRIRFRISWTTNCSRSQRCRPSCVMKGYSWIAETGEGYLCRANETCNNVERMPSHIWRWGESNHQRNVAIKNISQHVYSYWYRETLLFWAIPSQLNFQTKVDHPLHNTPFQKTKRKPIINEKSIEQKKTKTSIFHVSW